MTSIELGLMFPSIMAAPLNSGPRLTRNAGEDGGVLVVEDCDDVRECLALFLTLEGCFVRTAANGQEALDIIRATGAPAVIVLDLSMPVMDGWAFSAALSEDAALAAIPIIVLSSEHDKSPLVPQVVAALAKPASPDELYQLISKYRQPVCSA